MVTKAIIKFIVEVSRLAVELMRLVLFAVQMLKGKKKNHR